MDNVLQSEARCGCFQVLFAILTQLARFSTVWGLYIMMFGNFEPPWRCVMVAEDDQKDVNLSRPTFLDTKTQSQNISYSVTKNNDSGLSNSSHYFDGSCQQYPLCYRIDFEPGSSTIVTEFGLICDKAWIASFIISVELFAVVPGAYIGGQIGERFGRKVSLYGSTTLLSLSIALAIFSPNWELYTAFSFFTGLASGGILSTSVVYTMEFLSPWWRAMFASIPVWNASLAIFTLVVVALRDWRHIHIVSASLSGVTILGVLWVPESLRWLEVRGKRKEAIKVIKKIHKINRLKRTNDVSEEDTETTDDIASDKQIRANHKTYLDLFRDPYVRSITIKAATAWLCTLIAYLAMGYGVKSLAGDYYVNIIIASVSEVPMMLAIGPVANKLGRRWSAISFISVAAIACGTIVAVHFLVEGDTKGFTIKILALVAKACAAAAWCALATLSVELFPTVVRNLGYGFLTLVSRSGGIIAPYLIPQDPSWFAVCFSIMTLALLISIAMTISLPETKGRPLTDTIQEGQTPIKSTDEDEIEV